MTTFSDDRTSGTSTHHLHVIARDLKSLEAIALALAGRLVMGSVVALKHQIASG
jgi:hypothetical protein